MKVQARKEDWRPSGRVEGSFSPLERLTFELRLGERGIGWGEAIEAPVGVGVLHPEDPRKASRGEMEGRGWNRLWAENGLCKGSEAGACCGQARGSY